MQPGPDYVRTNDMDAEYHAQHIRLYSCDAYLLIQRHSITVPYRLSHID